MLKLYFLLCLTACLTLIFCQSGPGEIVGVMVHQAAPEFGPREKVTGYELDTARIYYSGKLRLYHLSYFFDSSDLVTGEKFLSEKRYHYFIYNTDSAFGYDYNTHFYPQKRRARVDSLLHWQWSPSINLYSMFTVNKTKLLSVQEDRDAGTTHETYSFVNEDSFAHGRMILGYSSKWVYLPYSFSRELDSIKRMKLFEALLIQDPRYLPSTGTTVDSIRSEYHLEPIKSIPPEVVKLFEDHRRLQ